MKAAVHLHHKLLALRPRHLFLLFRQHRVHELLDHGQVRVGRGQVVGVAARPGRWSLPAVYELWMAADCGRIYFSGFQQVFYLLLR